MWFWFLLACDIIVPIIMVIAGRWMWKHTPEDINVLIGYRTTRSMKNMDTWKFAHEHCGQLWWKIGWVMLLPSVLLHIPFYNASNNTIAILCAVVCTVQCVILVVSIFPTEKALKRTFTDEGIRK